MRKVAICFALLILVLLPFATADAAANERGTTVGNSVNYGVMAEENGVLYYINTLGSNPGIYAISADGEGKIQKSTLLLKGNYDNLQVIGGYLYYTRMGDDSSAGYLGLYRAKIDGTGATCLTKDIVAYQNILGGFIYYKNYSDNGRLYRMKADGTKPVCLSKDEVGAVNVVGDNIYYLNFSDNARIYTIKITGTGRKKLTDADAWRMNFVDGKFYCGTASYGSIAVANADGTNFRVIYKLTSGSVDYLNVSGNWIYFAENKGTLKRLSKDGSKLEEFSGIKIADRLSIHDDFCVDSEGNLRRLSQEPARKIEPSTGKPVVNKNIKVEFQAPSISTNGRIFEMTTGTEFVVMLNIKVTSGSGTIALVQSLDAKNTYTEYLDVKQGQTYPVTLRVPITAPQTLSITVNIGGWSRTTTHDTATSSKYNYTLTCNGVSHKTTFETKGTPHLP